MRLAKGDWWDVVEHFDTVKDATVDVTKKTGGFIADTAKKTGSFIADNFDNLITSIGALAGAAIAPITTSKFWAKFTGGFTKAVNGFYAAAKIADRVLVKSPTGKLILAGLSTAGMLVGIPNVSGIINTASIAKDLIQGKVPADKLLNVAANIAGELLGVNQIKDAAVGIYEMAESV